ncbi:hypothetical protein K3495_g11320 [Podosphaera aphanis]|nr:hypothetical protein K3495_g11320 [Podosphaera aphanis]
MPQCTESNLQEALEALANGQTLKKASSKWGVPRSTLQNRLKGVQSRDVASSDSQRLSLTQENCLAEWIRVQGNLGLPLTHHQFKVMAEGILQVDGNFRPLGKKWVQKFINRNPSIKVQRCRAIDFQRVNGASENIIRPWFDRLAESEIMAIKPCNRYNMDETGILEGRGSNGLVLGSSECRSLLKKQPGSRAWTSIIEWYQRPAPVIPFGRDFYDSWKFTATENGWIANTTAVEWLKEVFLPLTTPGDPQEKRLLIVDGHGSHETTEFTFMCFQKNVNLLFLPSYTSDVLQPLDQSVFSPLKTAYRKQLGLIAKWDAGTVMGKRNFITCYSKARQVALASKNIISGWKWAGLWPVNVAKPLSSPLMLTSTSTPSQPTCEAHPGKLSVKSHMKIANETSPVLLLTPRKKDELRGQLRLSSEEDYQIAAAQQKIEALESQVEAGRARNRRRDQTDPSSKFVDIESIRRAQIDAGDFINNTNETSGA